MAVGLDVRRPHEGDFARVDDDQTRPLAEPALQLRCEDRVAFCRVRADDQDTSDFMTESNACVPADSPMVLFRP